MPDTDSHSRGYLLAAVLGALGGGLVVAVSTKAIPKMVSAIMRNVMARMRESGCNPEEM